MQSLIIFATINHYFSNQINEGEDEEQNARKKGEIRT
jgi:hypothetical protein